MPSELVSVVIPTVGRVDLLSESLPILLADPATSEIILVLDVPHAESRLRSLGRGDGRVRVHVADPNRRLPAEQGGRDIGAALAQCGIVLALDDDVVPGPGLVTGHAHRHAGADDLVVLGYMPVSGTRLGGRERLYARGYERMCEAYQRDPDQVLQGLWGGNFSLRRDHWVKVAEADRVPVRYLGDRELGLALLRLGLRGVFVRELRAEHRFRRPIGALRDEARQAAEALARLSAAHPDVVEPPSHSRHRLLRAVARAMRRRRIEKGVQGILLAATRGSAVLGVRTVEDQLVKALWRLTFDRSLDATA